MIKSTSIELLNEFFDELKTRNFLFPDFTNDNEVIIFSDYSGERPEDKYYSYSFYLIDSTSALGAAANIMDLRKREPLWKNDSFIEYKKLNRSKMKQRILPHFLNIFDQIKGLVLTVFVDKTAPNYFLKVSDDEAKKIKDFGGGDWKTEILRKKGNIFSLLAFLVKRFLSEQTKLTWYSDRDPIFGTGQIKKDYTLDLLSKFLTAYEVSINGREYRYVSDKGTLLNSDFLAVADLSAAAVLEYYQHGYQNREIKETTKTTIAWMSNNQRPLKKLMIIGTEDNRRKKLITLKNYI